MENLRVPPEPMKRGEKLGLLQEVRSCPPTPQRFASPLGSQKKPAAATAAAKSVPPVSTFLSLRRLAAATSPLPYIRIKNFSSDPGDTQRNGRDRW